MQRFAKNRPPPGRRRGSPSTRAIRSQTTTPRPTTNLLTTTPPKRKRKPTPRKRRKRRRPTLPSLRLTMKEGDGRVQDVVMETAMGPDTVAGDMVAAAMAGVGLAREVASREG